jgi:hypothetical protein
MLNRPVRLSVYLWVSLFVVFNSPDIFCQPVQRDKPPIIDAQLRQKLVNNIVRELHAKYVVSEKTKEIESYLKAKLKSGAYDKIENAQQLTGALTEDLRASSKDLHLFVTYDPVL